MATTPSGLPYPVGTDKVVDGDDAIRALAQAVDPRSTRLVANEVAEISAGAAGQVVRSTSALVTLTPGTWLVHAAISVTTMNVPDHAACEVWDADAGTQVVGSRGCGGIIPAVSQAASLASMPVRMIVTANKRVQAAARPAGASILRIVSVVTSPPAWIVAELLTSKTVALTDDEP